MKKQKVISVITLAAYVLFLLLGLLLGFSMLYAFHHNEQDGFGGAAYALGTAILAILGFFYAAGALLPVLFRALFLKKEKIVFPILCLPFDLCYTVANGALLLSSLTSTGEELWGILVCLPLVLLSVALFAMNILSAVWKRKMPKGEKKDA